MAGRPGALGAVADAIAGQAAALVTWLTDVDDFGAATVLGGWDVRTLTAHLVVITQGLVEQLDAPIRPADPPSVGASEFVRRYRPAAASIAERTEAVRADLSGPELVARLRAAADPRSALADRDPTALVRGARGVTPVLDWARTRLLDLVVHADDLSRSQPDRAPVPLVRPALADATRLLAVALAEQQPGRSVELRVPPFVAVQAVPGPRHTRGTPPNVVETDAVTWLRLATGRLAFAGGVADGSVRATGARSDLTAFLPLLS